VNRWLQWVNRRLQWVNRWLQWVNRRLQLNRARPCVPYAVKIPSACEIHAVTACAEHAGLSLRQIPPSTHQLRKCKKEGTTMAVLWCSISSVLAMLKAFVAAQFSFLF
jgi:hypothetical protein